MELKAIKEKEAKTHPEIMVVKERLDKLEEAVKEIVVESKKQSGGDAIKDRDESSRKTHSAPTEPVNSQSTSGSREVKEMTRPGKEKSTEVASGTGKLSKLSQTPDASQPNRKNTTQKEGTLKDDKQ